MRKMRRGKALPETGQRNLSVNFLRSSGPFQLAVTRLESGYL
jgi:hypothetical protein